MIGIFLFWILPRSNFLVSFIFKHVMYLKNVSEFFIKFIREIKYCIPWFLGMFHAAFSMRFIEKLNWKFIAKKSSIKANKVVSILVNED